MGWGKKAATAPQPKVAAPVALAVEEPVVEEPQAPAAPTDAAKAQLAWHQLKSKKGWTDATLALLLYEFIASRGLFADLVKFTRRR